MRELAGDITASMCSAEQTSQHESAAPPAGPEHKIPAHRYISHPTVECTRAPVQMHIEPIPPTLQDTTHVELKTKWATMLD